MLSDGCGRELLIVPAARCVVQRFDSVSGCQITALTDPHGSVGLCHEARSSVLTPLAALHSLCLCPLQTEAPPCALV